MDFFMIESNRLSTWKIKCKNTTIYKERRNIQLIAHWEQWERKPETLQMRLRKSYWDVVLRNNTKMAFLYAASITCSQGREVAFLILGEATANCKHRLQIRVVTDCGVSSSPWNLGCRNWQLTASRQRLFWEETAWIYYWRIWIFLVAVISFKSNKLQAQSNYKWWGNSHSRIWYL